LFIYTAHLLVQSYHHIRILLSTQLHPTSLSLSILFLDSSSYSILLVHSLRHTSYHSPPSYILLIHPTLLLAYSSTPFLAAHTTSGWLIASYFLSLTSTLLLAAHSSHITSRSLIPPYYCQSLIPLYFSLSHTVLYHRSLIPPYFSQILNPPPSLAHYPTLLLFHAPMGPMPTSHSLKPTYSSLNPSHHMSQTNFFHHTSHHIGNHHFIRLPESPNLLYRMATSNNSVSHSQLLLYPSPFTTCLSTQSCTYKPRFSSI
jgi:hypothetical protein